MTTNQKYIMAGIVLLVLMSKAKGTCGCADNTATNAATPAQWWSYASQWST